MANGVFTVFDPSYQSVFINQSIINPHYAGTNIYIWAMVAGAAVLFTALAFGAKLRNEDGEVNPTKMGFCLLGTLFNAFASWFSVSIVVPLGMGVAIYLNQTVSIAQSTIVEGGALPYLFMVSGIFCFAFGVYMNVLPQMVKPDMKEFDGPVSAKVKAEQGGGKRGRKGIAEDDVSEDGGLE